MSIAQSEEDKALIKRQEQARQDRGYHQEAINRFYDLARPHRRYVASTMTDQTPRPLSEQDDVFDDTLMHTVSDFAAAMQDAFTPHYRPWAKEVASGGLSPADQRSFDDQIKRRQEKRYSAIRKSNFFEESQIVWEELAASAGSMIIPYAGISKPIRCVAITIAGLLIERGPDGRLNGRWQEFTCKRKELTALFPNLRAQLEAMPGGQNLDRSEQTCTVIQGSHRELNKPDTWVFTVTIDGEHVIQRKAQRGPGACAVHVLRWNDAPYSAWGHGPGMDALPSAQVLQELGYLFLKNLGKQVDPPFAYTMDGTLNFDGGIDAGDTFPMEPDSQFEFLVPKTDINPVMFERDKHRETVRRALYQNGPNQEGKTPPSASQWLGEKAQEDKRLQNARLRIYKEWVLPVLQRFDWILRKRGEIDDIVIGENVIDVMFENPISRASDAEDVARSMELAQSAVAIFGETFFATMDPKATVDNWIAKAGDELLVTKDVAQQPEELMALLGNMRNLSNNG